MQTYEEETGPWEAGCVDAGGNTEEYFWWCLDKNDRHSKLKNVQG
jgi:hypothetical protein